jgi:uncharacterized membrane protein YfcA
MAVAIAVVAIAGLLRGFSGFGLALAAVPGLTLVLRPAEAVPCVMLLQIVAGAQLLPSTRHHVDWRALAPILAAAVVATPVGTAILADVPPDPMRAAIGVVLLVAVALLWRGPRVANRSHGTRRGESAYRPSSDSRATRIGIGLLSGVLNGGTAMAGPPVIAYFLATSPSVEVGRASLLMYFFFLSLAGGAASAAAGLVTSQTIALSALLLPAVAIGNAIGHRLFLRASAEVYRRVALAILAAMAATAIARALVR